MFYCQVLLFTDTNLQAATDYIVIYSVWCGSLMLNTFQPTVLNHRYKNIPEYCQSNEGTVRAYHLGEHWCAREKTTHVMKHIALCWGCSGVCRIFTWETVCGCNIHKRLRGVKHRGIWQLCCFWQVMVVLVVDVLAVLWIQMNLRVWKHQILGGQGDIKT